jgi:hypothetical protein
VRAIVAGATGAGGFSLASEENPVWPAVETGDQPVKTTIKADQDDNEGKFGFFMHLSVSKSP